MRNPHFDDDRVLWRDEYAGSYEPVPYNEQFDGQWRLFLQGERGFRRHTGVETDDEYIDDRIYELTGVRNYLLRKTLGNSPYVETEIEARQNRAERRGVGGRLYLAPLFPIDFFQGKRCIDIGCGAGRWTKTLISLGANVKSVDVGDAALESTRRFNADVERLSIFELRDRTDLNSQFDFALCWGVVMCTHDPLAAFMNAAATVRPGGALYIMVYAPTYHSSDFVMNARRVYHRVKSTPTERVDYLRELAAGDEDNLINYLDMLNTFYNWVIDEETIIHWSEAAGFEPPIFLNRDEPHKCGHHVLLRRP